MSNEFLLLLNQHGYWAIFLLVFLQEVGVPNPIPNELLLFTAGYLVFSGILFFSGVILAAVLGDLLGSGILFGLFYFLGKTIIVRKPRWIPISTEKLNSISQRIQSNGKSSIVVGRLSPFIRGYVSVFCGLMRLSPRFYSLVLAGTATFWASAYVGAGFLLAPQFNRIIQLPSYWHWALSLSVISILPFTLLYKYIKHSVRTKTLRRQSSI